MSVHLFAVNGSKLNCSINRFIERFHMTSRRPCWCPKTKEWRPWWCTKLILRELNSIFMQILSFVSVIQYGCWSREWKRSICFNPSVVFFDCTHVIRRPCWCQNDRKKCSLNSQKTFSLLAEAENTIILFVWAPKFWINIVFVFCWDHCKT